MSDNNEVEMNQEDDGGDLERQIIGWSGGEYEYGTVFAYLDDDDLDDDDLDDEPRDPEDDPDAYGGREFLDEGGKIE